MRPIALGVANRICEADRVSEAYRVSVANRICEANRVSEADRMSEADCVCEVNRISLANSLIRLTSFDEANCASERTYCAVRHGPGEWEWERLSTQEPARCRAATRPPSMLSLNMSQAGSTDSCDRITMPEVHLKRAHPTRLAQLRLGATRA